MSAPIFPLRWESTGEQWWYASPIDCAAANGYYDLVWELLHIDTNLLIKLTSLRRIQRLETVWDDQDRFKDVAKCRAHVARNLLLDCETSAGHNTLIRAGYGGWILYTAASAGDVAFVKDLLERDPLLVFGEGEFGISDLLYAASRSNNSEVFKLLLNFAISLKSSCGEIGDGNGETEEGKKGEEKGEFCDGFKWGMMNRAIHALARGGNLELLKEFLMSCRDVLGYRDGQGSTILHAATGRGQVEVMKHLITCYDDILSSTDHQGNTALHIAAYRGFSSVVEALLLASPPLASLKNKQGDTLLHMVVAGFQTPGFHRINQQIDLLKQLIDGSVVQIQDLINVRNNHGRTALHLAVGETIPSDVVELLMTVASVDLNIRDRDGFTPLDLLRQRPHQNGTSKLLIKKLVSAGGVSSSSSSCLHGDDRRARRSSFLASHFRLQGYIGNSPGTSFRVPDSQILLYPENEDGSDEEASCYDDKEKSDGFSACSSQGTSHFDSPIARVNFVYDTEKCKASATTNSATRHLKEFLQWRKREARKETSDSFELLRVSQSFDKTPTPLRERFSGASSLANNKRVMPIRCEFPSPSPTARKKFTASLMQGVIQHSVMPSSALSEANSPLSPLSRLSVSSPALMDNKEKVHDHIRDYMAESPSSTKSCNGGGSSGGRKSRSMKHSLFRGS